MWISRLILFASLFLSSCGYHLGNIHKLSCYNTIYVPYANGDKEGILTSIIIKQLSQSSHLKIKNCEAQLTLNINLIDYSEENIGFRYDRGKKGKLIDSIIPAETRLTVLAEVCVVDNATCENLLGPVRIFASIEFDHDYYSSRNGINIFSLGQLSDIDGAFDAAYRPLYEELAEKIVEYLNGSW